MSLIKKIEEDLKSAMKAHEVQTVSTLRMLQSSVKNAAIAARTSAQQELNEADIEKVVKGEVKKLKDALVDFEKAARQDLIDKTNEELKILSAYLPEQLSGAELQKIVDDTIAEIKAAGEIDFGKAMKEITAKVKGAADGKEISELVKKSLS